MLGNILLNRYKIESELGKGGMGIVYHAQDTLLHRAVAIKFLNTEGVGTEGKARLLQEARAVAQLNHPNIVSVYDAGEVDGNPFIVMELVRGDTLRKTQKPTFANAILMAQQICLALDHAHSNGIIHRDLKLENIIITSSQTLKLMDFGLARTADDARLTQEGALMGTPIYIAPELIEGQPASVQSDLYALGIVLYELLVGHAPFQGEIFAVLGAHLHNGATPPSKFSDAIPAWVDDLVLGLLSKRPEERPASARAILDILEQKITPPITVAYRAPSKPRHNLPTQNTSFIGREKEIKEVIGALNVNRLVTLTGSGGSGKTRLSLKSAANGLDQFTDGVWFVELAPLTDPDLIPQTILTALGLNEQAGRAPLDVLKTFLQDRQTLIVLDNCEHLIEASARVTDELLNAAPALKILASSREALAVRGELAYPVPSLSLPDLKHLPDSAGLTQYEAVRLFVERATLVAPHFAVDQNNATFIAQICSRLDGIPLALELAAARVKVLSVEQIAKRLDDRFRLLTGGARTALPRQQTLRAAIDWSYNLISEQERILLRRLAVFVGGWTLEAAEDICAGEGIESDQILDLMSQLVNKSLVAVDEHSKSGETRYRILETVRQYAREKLFDTEEVSPIRDKQLKYFVKLAEQGEPELYRSNQVFWLNILDDELDNLRMALEWALTSNVESGIRIAAIPWRFWEARGYLRELGDWLGQLLENYNTVNALHTQALVIYATCFFAQVNFSESIKLAGQSLQMARALSDQRLEAFSLTFLGAFTLYQGNIGFKTGVSFLNQSLAIYRTLDDKIGQADAMRWLFSYDDDAGRAIELAKKSLKLYRELGNLSGIAQSLTMLAQMTYRMGDSLSPVPWLEEALYISHQLGDQQKEGWILIEFGLLAYCQGDYGRAKTYYEEAIILSEKIGNRYLLTWVQIQMAFAVLRQGDTQRACEMFATNIRNTQQADLTIGTIYTIEGLASFYANQNQPERAERLFAWADATRDQIGDHRPPVEQGSVDKDIEVIHSQVNDDEFARLSEEGRAMTTEQAIVLALDEANE